MTRKRYLAVAGMFAILVAAGFGVSMMIPPVPGVTKANFDRIENGMTEANVEATFGGPASFGGWGNYDFAWRNEDGSTAFIHFEMPGGKVLDKRWSASTETIIEKSAVGYISEIFVQRGKAWGGGVVGR